MNIFIIFYRVVLSEVMCAVFGYPRQDQMTLLVRLSNSTTPSPPPSPFIYPIFDDNKHTLNEEMQNLYRCYLRWRFDVVLRCCGAVQASHVPSLEGYALIVSDRRLMVVQDSKLEDGANKEDINRCFQDITLPITWKVLSNKPALHLLVLEGGFVAEEVSVVLKLSNDDFSKFRIRPKECFDHISVERVSSVLGLERFSRLHEGPTADFIRAFDIAEPLVDFFIASFDGSDVSVAQVIRSDNGLAGIHLVATHPDHRRRGYSSTLLTHVLRYLFEMEVEMVFVSCMQEVSSLYTGLGFAPFTQYTTYSRCSTVYKQ